MATKSGDLFLASDVHVMRGTKDKPEMEVVKGGQMLSDTDLTEKEIESIRGHGILRIPNENDLAAMERAASAPSKEDLAAAEDEKAKADELARHEADRVAAAAAGITAPPASGARKSAAKSGARKSGGKK